MLAEILGDGLLASYLLATSSPVRAETEPGDASFADPIELRFDVTPSDAVDYFRRKQVVTRRQFDLLSEDARAAAFTVAGVYKKDILEGFKSEIASALETGTAQAKVIKRFREILAGAGHQQLGAFHLETVFRTNMQVAYGVGRRRSLEEVAEDLPHWQYHTAGDDRVRPEHAVLNGIILPANHEFWDAHFPPWGFNCRCAVTATDSIPDDYDHKNPSGLGEITYDRRGNPAKAEYETSVIDLAAAGQLPGIPRQGGLRAVIEAGVTRAKRKRAPTPKKKVPSLEESLNKHEQAIVGRRTEMAVTLDQAGKVVFKKTNNAIDYVRFSNAQVAKMKGMIVTHNHPSGRSLSIPDVRLAMKAQIAEMRAVGKVYRYSMKPGPGGWTEDLWHDTVVPAFRAADLEVRSEFLSAIRSGRMTPDAADMQYQHEVWTRVAKKTGLRYERTTW